MKYHATVRTGASVQPVADLPSPPSVTRTAGLSMVAVVALGGTRLVYSVLVGRAGGPVVLGAVNAAISYATLATLLVSAGTGAAAAKFVAAAYGVGRPGEAAGVTRLLSGWTAAGTAISVLAAGALAPVLLGRVDGPLLAGTLALLVAYAGYTYTKGLLYGAGQVRRYVRLEVATDAAALLLTALAVLAGDAWLLVPLVAGYAGFTAVAFAARPRGPADPLSPARRAEIRTFVWLAVLGTVASTGFLLLSQLAARRYAAPPDVGRYAAALALIAPAYFLPRALSLALFPAMAGAASRGEGGQVQRQADVGTRVIAVGMLPLFAGAVFLAGPLLTLFYGGRYAAGAGVLAVLMAATYISVVPVPAVNSLVAGDRRYVGVPAWSSVAGLALGVGWWAVFGPAGGALAVAVGYLVGSVVQAGVPVAVAWRRHRLAWGRLALRVAGGVALAGGLAWWLAAGRHGIVAAVLATVVFAAAWWGAAPADVRLATARLTPLLGKPRRP